MTSDLELLRNYTLTQSEDSFTALVHRHLNLVYSAALRQVRSPELAEEVAQSTFIDLARQAARLKPETNLTAWLYQVTRRTAINVVRSEARRQAREKIAGELAAMNATVNDWTQVELILDEAMDGLSDSDRAAVLLRYFENKPLREVGQLLGMTDNAAQKRISRAVEQLQEFFAKRDVKIASGGLAIAISANAVQAAPAALAATISAASAIAGASIAVNTTAVVTKTVAMTALQKGLIAATVVAVAGAGIFEAHKASTLESTLRRVEEQQGPLAGQIQQLEHDRDDLSQQVQTLRSDNARLDRATPELLRLRNQVGMLRDALTAQQAAMPASSRPSEKNATADLSAVKTGEELGLAVVKGEPGAFDRLVELSKNEFTSYHTNNIGLNDEGRGNLARETFAPLHAAFKVIEDAAVTGNQTAIDAVGRSADISELQGSAVKAIGAIAGLGNEEALDMLLHPRKYNFQLSSTVAALRPAADNGNEKAIAALAAVAGNKNDRGLWYMAAEGLEKSAASGNATALDAIIGLAASTNINVRNAILPALRTAASNQNPKATEALRSMGLE